MPDSFISTGVLGLDIHMNGGWKRGTINEVWGEPSTGKTVLALEAVKALGTHERPVTWINTSGPIDFSPLPFPDMIIGEPRTAEAAFDIAMSASGVGTSLIIIDDANHLVRQAELSDPSYVPDEHREFKNELTMLKRAVKNSGAVVLFLSQPRDTYRAPIRGTGISEKSYDRLSLRAREQHQDKTAVISAQIKRTGEHTAFFIEPGKGVSKERQLYFWGRKSGFVEQKASWTVFRQPAGDRLIQVHGQGEFEQYMRDHADEADVLEYMIRQHYGIDFAYVLNV